MIQKTTFSFAFAAAILITGCTGSETVPASDANVVEITAIGLELLAPDEIPSGWTTFRLKNETDMIHFAVVQRLPEGIGAPEHQEFVAPVFQQGMDLINSGEFDAAMAKFGELPEWFNQIVFNGGPGLISGGKTAQMTMFLEPGSYLMECYVKTNGIFHSFNPSPTVYGMIHGFTVTEDSSSATAPSASVEITLSSGRGMEILGDVLPGENTIAVYFEDQTVHENFLGHDVHIVRLTDDADIKELATWMDWSQPMGLQTPSPFEFIGGTHEMPAGSTAYFTVNLEPGQYAWISEVTSPDTKGMLKTFTVESAIEGGD